MEQSDVCLTPRTIRKRRLLRANGASNPELESLYHDRSTMVSPPVTSPYPRHSPLVTLGTPTHQHLRGTPRRLRDVSNAKVNSIFGPSLPLNERLERAIKQDHHSRTSLDLSGYEIMPSKMDAAFSAAAAEPLFSRQNFFQDPPQQLTTLDDGPKDEHDDGDIPPQSPQIPPSPTSSITSTATTISESVNMALLSWPGSPSNDWVKHNTGLTFGRVGSSSAPTLTFSSPPPPPPSIVFSPAYVPPISSPLAFAQRSPKPSSPTRSPSPHTSPCPSSHQEPACLKRRVVRRSRKSATRRPTKFVASRPRLPQRWAVTTTSRPIRITPWKESTITPNGLA
ncbi:hypothetical protein [Absidia glauca]|uniref:Uncharacterized protein n=1 Tax=Absidia glauca TaxID=4829 RepID=A0A163JMB2_ABSGL|nr:hypothetical protein [Absidia glauca]